LLAIFAEEDCNLKAKLLLSERKLRRERKMQKKVKDEHADTHRE